MTVFYPKRPVNHRWVAQRYQLATDYQPCYYLLMVLAVPSAITIVVLPLPAPSYRWN